MKDLNFFDPYIQEEKFAKKKKRRPVILVIILLIFVGTAYMGRTFIIDRITDTFVKDEPSIEDEKLDDLNQKQLELERLKSADEHLKASNIIDRKLLEDIVSKVPKNVACNFIDIGGGVLQIRGDGETVNLAIDYSDKLRAIEVFNSLFITSITYDKSEGLYRFILDIDLNAPQMDGDDENMSMEISDMDMADLEIEKQSILSQYLSDLDHVELFYTVEKLVEDANIYIEDVSLTKPASENIEGYTFKYIDISLIFKGKYNNILKLIENIKKTPGNLFISQVTVDKKGDDTSLWSGRILIRAYSY